MMMSEASDDRSRPRPLLWAVLVAAILGVVETVKAFVAGRSAPNQFGWPEAAATNLPWWLLWGLMAPVILLLVRRHPLRRDDWARPLLVHLGAAAALSLVHLFVSALIVWAAVSHAFLDFGSQLESLLAGYLVTDLVTYGAIVAVWTSWDSQRRLREAARERRTLELRAARLEARAARLESQMTEARLEALRLELNPHFLFNALNSVASLAHRGDGRRAVEAVNRLSELLRRTLDDDLEGEVTVAEELELLEPYLALERLRHGERLTIGVTVEAGARDALVPSLVLQPLVENAMRHGLGSVTGPVRLDVEARIAGEALEIEVRDTGRGFDPAPGRVEEGVGLRNTRRRLETLYGDAAGLELGASGTGGARVRLRLPLRRAGGVRVGT